MKEEDPWIESISDFENETYFNSPFLHSAGPTNRQFKIETLQDSEYESNQDDAGMEEQSQQVYNEPQLGMTRQPLHNVEPSVWQANSSVSFPPEPQPFCQCNHPIWAFGNCSQSFQQQSLMSAPPNMGTCAPIGPSIVGHVPPSDSGGPFANSMPSTISNGLPRDHAGFVEFPHPNGELHHNLQLYDANVPPFHPPSPRCQPTWSPDHLNPAIPPQQLYQVPPSSPLASMALHEDMSSTASNTTSHQNSTKPSFEYPPGSIGSFQLNIPPTSFDVTGPSSKQKKGSKKNKEAGKRKRLPSKAPSKPPSSPSPGYQAPAPKSYPNIAPKGPGPPPLSNSSETPVIPASTKPDPRYRSSGKHPRSSSPLPAEYRSDKDEYLIQSRQSGMTYKEIKAKGDFHEAESTLRGRYRMLTKSKEARVRRPAWSDQDIALLENAVELACRDKDPARVKVPWKQVAKYIYDNGGSYLFGNATCRKKWDELQMESEDGKSGEEGEEGEDGDDDE